MEPVTSFLLGIAATLILTLGAILVVVRPGSSTPSASPEPFECPHGPNNLLCRRYGCPDDPDWKGDRRG